MAIKINGFTVIDDSSIHYGDGSGLCNIVPAGTGGEIICTATTGVALTIANKNALAICYTGTSTNPICVCLPNATTMSKGNSRFAIKNINNNVIVVKDYTANTILSNTPYSSAEFALYDNSTSSGKWSYTKTTDSGAVSVLCCNTYSSLGGTSTCCYVRPDGSVQYANLLSADCTTSSWRFTLLKSDGSVSYVNATFPIPYYCLNYGANGPIAYVSKNGWVVPSSTGRSAPTTINDRHIFGIVNCDHTCAITVCDDTRCSALTLPLVYDTGNSLFCCTAICGGFGVNVRKIRNCTNNCIGSSALVYKFNTETTGAPGMCTLCNTCFYSGGAIGCSDSYYYLAGPVVNCNCTWGYVGVSVPFQCGPGIGYVHYCDNGCVRGEYIGCTTPGYATSGISSWCYYTYTYYYYATAAPIYDCHSSIGMFYSSQNGGNTVQIALGPTCCCISSICICTGIYPINSAKNLYTYNNNCARCCVIGCLSGGCNYQLYTTCNLAYVPTCYYYNYSPCFFCSVLGCTFEGGWTGTCCVLNECLNNANTTCFYSQAVIIECDTASCFVWYMPSYVCLDTSCLTYSKYAWNNTALTTLYNTCVNMSTALNSGGIVLYKAGTPNCICIFDINGSSYKFPMSATTATLTCCLSTMTPAPYACSYCFVDPSYGTCCYCAVKPNRGNLICVADGKFIAYDKGNVYHYNMSSWPITITKLNQTYNYTPCICYYSSLHFKYNSDSCSFIGTSSTLDGSTMYIGTYAPASCNVTLDSTILTTSSIYPCMVQSANNSIIYSCMCRCYCTGTCTYVYPVVGNIVSAIYQRIIR